MNRENLTEYCARFVAFLLVFSISSCDQSSSKKLYFGCESYNRKINWDRFKNRFPESFNPYAPQASIFTLAMLNKEQRILYDSIWNSVEYPHCSRVDSEIVPSISISRNNALIFALEDEQILSRSEFQSEIISAGALLDSVFDGMKIKFEGDIYFVETIDGQNSYKLYKVTPSFIEYD